MHVVTECYFFPAICYESDIRLVGGTGPQEGRVEVCYGGAWGTVTDFGFNIADARVVCRQLGYNDNCEYPFKYELLV